MAENILNLFADRSTFVHHLEQDIHKNNKILEETTKELDTLKELIENVKTLGQYPEHTSLIPLAKNIYMKGKIIHTGEHYLKITATPESYIVLNSLEQTLKSLGKKVEAKESEIEKAEYANYQLEERMKILKGDTEDILPNTENDLPNEIKSGKGVAVKVGQFYEIVEYED